ncbi:ATP-binding protein [Polaromonas sp.]|uniref:ATP-binding protein n=1 Tax=Polaromonas sp. TaxID=1869339 RepID=UPI002FC6D2CE
MNSLELANEGILILDDACQITAANSRAQVILRSTLPSLTGADFWDVVSEDVAKQHQRPTSKALKSSSSHVFVAYHRFEDGWVEYHFRRQPSGCVVNVRDVSDTYQTLRLLDQSERCNQMLFDVNPNAMWIFDSSTLRILAANQAAVLFYGIPHNAFLELSLGALFPDAQEAAQFSEPPAAGDIGREFALSMRLCKQKKMDGQIVLVELAGGRVEWKGYPAVLVSLADVTGRHLADANLRRLNAELEQQVEQSTREQQRTSRDLEAFTYAMSNDLKAPLHVVNGFAKTLAEKYAAVLDRQGLHYLERIQVSTRQLAKLVEDLLVLTQIPRMAMTPELVDLAPVCNWLMDELRKRTPEREVALEMEPQLLVTGDKSLLVTALTCLLDNAWKFTAKKPQGWIKVGLMAGQTPDERVLFVSDNGAGFDPAYAGKLFTAFQRLHSSADFPGNGLGLALVKRIASRHQGEVWADSTENSGASFFMSLSQKLPQAQPEVPEVPEVP